MLSSSFRDLKPSLSNKKVRVPNVTQLIDEFISRFPNSTAKKALEMLDLDYKTYANMYNSRKSMYKKWSKSKVYGRVLKALNLHRLEWMTGKPLGSDVVASLWLEASKCMPAVNEVKPFRSWYVIPNRNRCMLFKDDDVTVRVFQNGTVRVLPSRVMGLKELRRCVEYSFFMGGLDLRVVERISRELLPCSRHRTFEVSDTPIPPFKIDFYKPSLGLTILSDGSHPYCVETIEDYPPWFIPWFDSVDKFGEEIKEYKEQNRSHIELLEKWKRESDERVNSSRRKSWFWRTDANGKRVMSMI